LPPEESIWLKRARDAGEIAEEGGRSAQALKPPQPVRLQHTVSMNYHAADREKSRAIVKKV
jgi:hypothetical protein